jgi:hypothetical protein
MYSVYRFSPGRAKNDRQKKKSTMLPQAKAASYTSIISLRIEG